MIDVSDRYSCYTKFDTVLQSVNYDENKIRPD
jgi:hypothetical protein